MKLKRFLTDFVLHKDLRDVSTPHVRTDLEYPTVDIDLNYLSVRKKAQFEGYNVLITVDNFTDKAIYSEGRISGAENWVCIGRVGADISQNAYFITYGVSFTTQDFRLYKVVAGTTTNLGYEAVDLTEGSWTKTKLSCQSTTIKSYRDNVEKNAVTDTSHTSGKFGCGIFGSDGHVMADPMSCILKPAGSPSPKPLYFFEVPIIGSGTITDPFKADLPSNIVSGIDKSSLSNSVLIKSGVDGKPTQYTAIVRILEQLDRNPALDSILSIVENMRTQIKYKELTQTEAISRAKQLDDKLTDFDFNQYKKTELTDIIIKEFIESKKKIFNVEYSIDEAIDYLVNNKGWIQ